MAAEDPSVSGVSGRYATALFELARDEKSVDAVKADLDKFNAMLAESVELQRLVRSPVFGAEVQQKALAAVLAQAGISGIAANFLKVLTANRRLFAVADVIRAFNALVAKFKGEVSADVTVAEALSDKNLDALKAALKTVTDNVPSSIVVISCLEDYYIKLKAHLTKSVIDRVERSGDEHEACFDLAYEQATHALSLPGVAGLHFISFRKDAGIAKLCSRLGFPPRVDREEWREDAHGSRVAV